MLISGAVYTEIKTGKEFVLLGATTINNGEATYHQGIYYDEHEVDDYYRSFDPKNSDRTEVHLQELPSFNRSRRLDWKHFKSHYEEKKEPHTFLIKPRLNEGYVSNFGEVEAHCPVCDHIIGPFEVNAHEVCESCKTSFFFNYGKTHDKCDMLFRVETTSQRADYEFKYYENGTTRGQYKKLYREVIAADEEFRSEMERLFAFLFYFEKNVIPELSRRAANLKAADKSNYLSMVGYIIELRTLIDIIKETLHTFKFKCQAYLDPKMSKIIFGSNHIRHLDERDIQLISSIADHREVCSDDKVFGLDPWEYKNFLSLKKKFGINFHASREEIVLALFNTLPLEQSLLDINGFFYNTINKEWNRLCKNNLKKTFNWVTEAVSLP